MKRGLDKSFKEAPFFYWFYTLLIVLGAGVVLIPEFSACENDHFVAGVEWRAVAGCDDLHVEADQSSDLMGEHVNSHWFNAIAWLTAVVVIALSVMMLFTGGA